MLRDTLSLLSEQCDTSVTVLLIVISDNYLSFRVLCASLRTTNQPYNQTFLLLASVYSSRSVCLFCVVCLYLFSMIEPILGFVSGALTHQYQLW